MVTCAAGDGGRGPEVRGAGGVGLDGVICGLIGLLPRHPEIAITFPVIGDAEVFHYRQGQVHVRAGDQLVGDLDLHPCRRQGADEQQGRDVLAADRAGEPGAAAFEATLDGNRRAAVAFFRSHLHPQLLQGLQEIAQGPLAKARRAGEACKAPAPRTTSAVRKRMEVPELPR